MLTIIGSICSSGGTCAPARWWFSREFLWTLFLIASGEILSSTFACFFNIIYDCYQSSFSTLFFFCFLASLYFNKYFWVISFFAAINRFLLFNFWASVVPTDLPILFDFVLLTLLISEILELLQVLLLIPMFSGTESSFLQPISSWNLMKAYWWCCDWSKSLVVSMHSEVE